MPRSGVKISQLSMAFDSLTDPCGQITCSAERRPRFDELRSKLHCPPKRGNCSFRMPVVFERGPQCVPGFGDVRMHREKPVQSFDGFVMAPAEEKRTAEVCI